MFVGALSVAVILLILLISEELRNIFKIKPEVTRKFVHISVGCFVAFWPFFMPRWVIYAICAAFISVNLISRVGHLFPSIYKIRRKTWGDLFFPMGIALSLLIADSNWIFAASILHMSLADGVAGLVGMKYGGKTSYKIFGYKKTLAGNLAFLIVSFGIMLGITSITASGLSGHDWLALAVVPLVATAVESLSIRGSDNVFVPVSVAWMLNILANIA